MEPKLTVSPSGDKRWRLSNGLLHRADGPAIISLDGTESWWFEGKLHRADGPAITYPDGLQIWFLNGKRIRWKNVLKRIAQPGYMFSPFEVSMVEHYLEKNAP